MWGCARRGGHENYHPPVLRGVSLACLPSSERGLVKCGLLRDDRLNDQTFHQSPCTQAPQQLKPSTSRLDLAIQPLEERAEPFSTSRQYLLSSSQIYSPREEAAAEGALSCSCPRRT
ncbi:hypothetical protein QQF64_025268 [Cirrhinus molitorella]|uniref:Uncharacterized protein n=1 Tax=Cirrhinus molitorella TaxID=172907 RepID=A0ABR3NNK5_9TELE